jgi:hypothetical protein
MLRMLFFIVLCALGADLSAATLYVSSDIGHEMTVVTRADVSGSHVDHNQYDVYPLRDDSLDQTFVRNVLDLAAKASPRLEVFRFDLGADATTYEATDDVLMNSAIGRLKNLAPGDRILIILPHRLPIKFTVLNGIAGTGKAAGLGAYIDRDRDWTADTRENDAAGTIAMFVNYRVVIIDPATRKITFSDEIATGEARSGGNGSGRSPWDALTPVEKLELLKTLVATSLDKSITPQLAGMQ